MSRNFTIILVMLLASLGPSIVIASVGYSAIRAVGRNPSASPKIFRMMFLAFVLSEGVALIALLIAMYLFR